MVTQQCSVSRLAGAVVRRRSAARCSAGCQESACEQERPFQSGGSRRNIAMRLWCTGTSLWVISAWGGERQPCTLSI
jgi:hypothetical protein